MEKKNFRMKSKKRPIIDVLAWDEFCGCRCQINLAVNKINKVPTGKQAIRVCMTWPVDNKQCVDVNRG